MTPHQKKVVDLFKEVGNKSEVARRLGVHESTVRQILIRAQQDPGITQVGRASCRERV